MLRFGLDARVVVAAELVERASDACAFAAIAVSAVALAIKAFTST